MFDAANEPKDVHNLALCVVPTHRSLFCKNHHYFIRLGNITTFEPSKVRLLLACAIFRGHNMSGQVDAVVINQITKLERLQKWCSSKLTARVDIKVGNIQRRVVSASGEHTHTTTAAISNRPVQTTFVRLRFISLSITLKKHCRKLNNITFTKTPHISSIETQNSPASD